MTLKNHKIIDTNSGYPITSIILNPFKNDTLYGFITSNHSVQFYNFQTAELIFCYKSQFHKIINSLSFFQSQSKFITCSNFIEFFDLKRNDPIKWIKPYNSITSTTTTTTTTTTPGGINGNGGYLDNYDFNKINDIIVLNDDVISTCDEKRQLCLYDLRQSSAFFKPTQMFIDATDSLNTMSYHSGKYTLHAGSNDGKLYTYDIRMGLLTINEMDQVITNIKGHNDYLLINRLNANPVIFDATLSEIVKEIKVPIVDQEYKVGNCFYGPPNGCITCSERGMVYFYNNGLELEEYDLQKTGNGVVLGCCDSYEDMIAIGDGTGKIDLFSLV